MSDLLLRRLRKDLLLNTHLPEYDGIDKAVEEETGKECDEVAQEYSNDQLLKLIRRILEKRDSSVFQGDAHQLFIPLDRSAPLPSLDSR